MGSDVLRVEKRLRAFELKSLFLDDLGWDRAALSFSATLIEPGQRGLGPRSAAVRYVPDTMESRTFTLNAVAQKRGVMVFVCSSLPDGTIPNAPQRYRLQHKVTKIARENIVVFADKGNTHHVWQWVRRGADVPIHVCEHPFALAQGSKALAERLMHIAVGLEEEDAGHITLAEILRRVYTAFHTGRVRQTRAPQTRKRLGGYDFAYFEDGLRAWLEYVFSIPRLGRQEEQQLARAALRGNMAARQRLIEANLYLVAEVAWKATQEGRQYRDMLPDLMQEGYFGLIGSVDNFDPELGYRFQTYAPRRILNHITREIQELSRPIRLPTYLFEWLALIAPIYAREADRLWQRLGREPTMQEVAAHLNLTPKQEERLHLLEDQVVSSDAPSLVSRLQSMVDGDATHQPFAAAVKPALHHELREALNALTTREKSVLILRFGLDDDEPRTLEEVGRVLDVTRERVRQLESAALGRLRKRSRNRRLRELMSQ